jgi:hypothetical protein
MARAQAKSVSRHFRPFRLIQFVTAIAPLPSLIMGKMILQGLLRALRFFEAPLNEVLVNIVAN